VTQQTEDGTIQSKNRAVHDKQVMKQWNPRSDEAIV